MTDNEKRITEVEKKIVDTDARARSNTRRLNEIDEEIKENRSLIVAIEKLAAEMKSMRESLDQTISRLNQLEKETVSEDAEKWKKFTWYAFIAVVGGVLGYIGTKLGIY